MQNTKANKKILFLSLGCVFLLCIALYIGLRSGDNGPLGSEEVADNGIGQRQQREQVSRRELSSENRPRAGDRLSRPVSVIQERAPSSPKNRSDSIFADRSIVESWEKQAIAFGWGYDELANNILLWKGLCGSRETDIISAVSSYIDSPKEELGSKITSFCKGFNEWRGSAGQEFSDVYAGEAVAGQTSYHSMLSELENLEKPNRLELVSHRLNRAIAQLNEAAVIDILSYLAFSNFGTNQVRGEAAEVSNQYGVEQIITTSSILICEQIGGCGPTHLLTIRICQQFTQRLCSKPDNIYDAIYQQLTGLEAERLVYFLRRVDAIRLQSR